MEAVGQEHVLKYWDELNEESQAALLKQINNIAFEDVNSYYQ
mgnify:FL=1